MATTTNWSITYPTSANQITPLETHFANLAGSTDTALTTVRNQSGRYTGTNAQRLALVAGTGRSEGTEFYTTDTDKNWMYDGTQWVNSDPGLFIVTPAAAPTGFTVDADGSLVATNLSTGFRNFDNIFSGRFRNYRMEVNVVKNTTSGTSVAQFRSGGSTISNAAYSASAIYTSNGSAPASSFYSNQTSMTGGFADDGGTYNYSVLEIANPFIAQTTIVKSDTVMRGTVVGQASKTYNHEDATSMTGLSINFGQTIVSCRIRFYGYA